MASTWSSASVSAACSSRSSSIGQLLDAGPLVLDRVGANGVGDEQRGADPEGGGGGAEDEATAEAISAHDVGHSSPT